MNEKPLGTRIRSFCEQLFTSRHVRFLEAELVRERLEYQAAIRELKEERSLLLGRLPPAASRPQPVKSSTLEVPASGEASFLAALEEHNRRQEELWQQAQSQSPRNESGVADAKR